jgi:hypothetical protein
MESFSRAADELRASVALLDQTGAGLRSGDMGDDARDCTVTLAALAQHIGLTAVRVSLHVGQLGALADLGLITIPGSDAADAEG